MALPVLEIRMDRYATEFLERVFVLLVSVEEADPMLVTDEVAKAAADLREFLADHGKRLMR